MDRRHFLKTLGSGAAALALAPLSRAAEPVSPARKPNIVLILADDFGWGSLGCYGADPKLLKTPNVDGLARQGRRFTDACTPSSVCSPTRYGVLAGRYCWRTSLKSGVLGITAPLHIEPFRLTLPSLLKSHGYNTAAIGKWHLGYGDQPKADFLAPLRPGPLELGFDTHFAVASNHGDVTGVYIEGDRIHGLRSSRAERFGASYYRDQPFMGFDAPQRKDDEVMDVLTDRVVDWLGKQSPEKPFFLYFTPTAVHEPVTPSTRGKGASAAGPYGDYIQDLDRCVGRVLEALERGNLAENTLVIFTSDNGGENKKTRDGMQLRAIEAGLAINGPLRAGKHSIYEGGFRVPFIARWPGRIPAGTTCDETIQLTDLLATAAAIVGEPLPPPAQAAEDSYNALPALLGADHARPLRPALIVHSVDGVFAIRRGPWKYIEGKPVPNLKPGVLKTRADQFCPQLYNLQDDPQEKNDLSAARPELVRELAALLARHRRQGFSRA